MAARGTAKPATMLLTLLAVLGVYAFLQSQYFSVTDIQVSGNRYYSGSQLVDASGLAKGENIFACDTDQAKILLTRLPFVGQASVKRQLPGRVLVQVSEITPVAMASVGSEFWGISDTGSLLGPLPESFPTMPVVTGVDSKVITSGKHVGAVVLAARVIRGLSPDMRAVVSEISLQDRSDLVIITSDLIRVHLGDESDLEKKLKVLEALLPDVRQRGLRVKQVFLHQYDNPVLKY